MKYYEDKSELENIREYYHNNRIIEKIWLFKKYTDLLEPFNNSSLNLLVHIYLSLSIFGGLAGLYYNYYRGRAIFIDIFNAIVYQELNPISNFFSWIS